MSHTRVVLPTVLLAVALAVTACTPAPPAPSDPAASASTEPSTGPSDGGESDALPTSAPDAFVIPGCADQLDLAVVQENFAADAEFIGDLTSADAEGAMAGPVAQEALATSVAHVGCLWGVPFSDGAFAVVVAELTPERREVLTSALAGSAFAAATVGGAPAFVWERDDVVGTVTTVYVFAEPAWVTVTGAGTTASHEPIAADILEHLRAVNPSLGS